MKTFQEFTQVAEEAKKTLKDILGPGIPSEKPTSTSKLTGRTSTSTVDYATPYYPTKSPVVRPLNKATYSGRVNAGRGPGHTDNPDYTGPIKDAGSGTKDKMPGTTPSSSPNLPPAGTKGTKGTKPNPSIKPKGTDNWV